MAQSRLDETWLPRIGPKATAALRRRTYVSMFMTTAGVALAIGGGAGIGTGTTVGTVLGVAALTLVAVSCGVLVRAQIQLNAAVREALAGRLPGRRVPPLVRASAFDSWCRKHDVQLTTAEATADPNNLQ